LDALNCQCVDGVTADTVVAGGAIHSQGKKGHALWDSAYSSGAGHRQCMSGKTPHLATQFMDT
jgi:hypothetical protein